MSWNLFCYHDQRGTCEVCDWYKTLSLKNKAKWDNIFNYLKSAPRTAWQRPYIGTLQGDKCNNLFEARFFFEKVQHRPLGFFGPNGNQFTFLLYAKEKNGNFIPPDACILATKRMIDAIQNPSLRLKKCPF
jgi:hypothetical protein